MKTAIITGAGSGIGRATAVQLAKDGFKLILIGRNLSTLQVTKTLLQGGGHECRTADVREKTGLLSIAEEFAKEPISCVFANAGVGGENTFGDEDRWDEIIATNLTGAYNTVQAFLPVLKKQTGFKHLIITSSCLARFGVPRYTAYCAAKAGILGLTRSLAIELASSQILVNALCPGWVETEMATSGIRQYAEHAGKSYEQEFRNQMSYVPTGKMSQPEEIANMVSWLFSDKQISMTGQAIDINNGAWMG